MPVELEEVGCEVPPNIPLDGVVSLLSPVLLVTVWLPKTEADDVPVGSAVFAAAEPPNTEGVAVDVPKTDVLLVLVVLVDPPNIPPVEAEEVFPPPNIPLGGEAAFSLPVLLAASGAPKTDVPVDDDVAPVAMLDWPVAAVVRLVEPNTDLFGAEAVNGGGPPEELPESFVVGVTEAEETGTVLLEPPIPNTDGVEVGVVIPPKTDDEVVVVAGEEICPKMPAVVASFPVVETVTVLLAPPIPKTLAVVTGFDWTMTEAEFDPKEGVG